jgi:hypothetical protein
MIDYLELYGKYHPEPDFRKFTRYVSDRMMALIKKTPTNVKTTSIQELEEFISFIKKARKEVIKRVKEVRKTKPEYVNAFQDQINRFYWKSKQKIEITRDIIQDNNKLRNRS